MFYNEHIHQSILEKLTALNIDIYHYEEIVRCYGFAKLNIEHSQKPDYEDFEEHWKADSTQRSNHLRYCNQIIPLLGNHDETSIIAYTHEDYDAVIQTLIRRGQDTKGKQYMDQIYLQTKAVVEELGEKAGLKAGQILEVGCSTSEVLGAKIGSNSSPEVAKYIFKALQEYSAETGVHIAIQCCEHLNRDINVERKAAPNAEIVNVVPQPKTGGSLATQAYTSFEDPVALEEIKADAGMDIGFPLIGMHLKKVAVPVRLENKHIGNALIVAARTRPKFIGGSRAIYADDMK